MVSLTQSRHGVEDDVLFLQPNERTWVNGLLKSKGLSPLHCESS